MIGADDFSFFGMDRLEMVDQTGSDWNQLVGWLHRLQALRAAG
jgi:hypothetical protein